LLSPTASTYAAEVDDAARVITVAAKTDTGADDTFTAVSDNPTVVSVVKAGNSISLNPLAAGIATITFTSASNLTRTITATIAPKFVMPTETYTLAGLVVPAAGETSSYEDQVLSLTFDAPPTLGTAGSVRIFKVSDDTLVDTIKVTGESDAIGSGILRTLNTRPIRINGNTASITLHSNKLALGTAYYAAVSAGVFTGATFNGKAFAGIGKNAGWSFTTRSAAPAAGLTSLIVDDNGNTANFRTLQSALNYVMQNVALDTPATITVKDGIYEEPLYLRNKNNLTIVGESRAGVVLQYPNNEGLNSGSSGRPVFLVETADLLTLDTLTLKNTTLIGAGAQAEAIYFNSPNGRLIAKNANFVSEQDTLQLNGWNWFYKSLVAGNVDFIWGGSNAALFEQSEIRTLGRSSGNDNGGYVLQARVKAATDKGFVFLNSSLTGDAGPTGVFPKDGTHYLARSPGGTTTFDNVVFVNTKIGTHISPIGWAGLGINSQPASNPGTGNATTGWREYGSMDLSGTTLNVSSRQFGYQLSLGEIANTFCSRAQIFAGFNANAGWNPLPSDTTDCVHVNPSSSSSAPASSTSSTSSAAAVSSSSSSSLSSSNSSGNSSSSSISSVASSSSNSSVAACSNNMLTENFSVDKATLFSAAYKSISTDSSAPLFFVTGTTAGVTTANDELTLAGGRFSIGNKPPRTSTAAVDTSSNGDFDLHKAYKISFKVTGVGAGTAGKKLIFYVDNNGSSSATSMYGASSQLWSASYDTLPVGQTVSFTSTVGSSTSFIQVRTETGANITIDDLQIEYVDCTAP